MDEKPSSEQVDLVLLRLALLALREGLRCVGWEGGSCEEEEVAMCEVCRCDVKGEMSVEGCGRTPEEADCGRLCEDRVCRDTCVASISYGFSFGSNQKLHTRRSVPPPSPCLYACLSCLGGRQGTRTFTQNTHVSHEWWRTVTTIRVTSTFNTVTSN